MEIREALWDAAEDFRYLLNRGYPRDASLQLVGNRYKLTQDLRHILRRGVFSNHIADKRKQKTIPVEALCGERLAIDGHNVLITLESALKQQTILSADDGFIRDIAGVSGHYQKGAVTGQAAKLIIELLETMSPEEVLFLFDSPITGSGELASHIRWLLSEKEIKGDALAVKVPERIMQGYDGIIASSDTAVIDQAQGVFDLAGHLIRERLRVRYVDLRRRERIED